MICLATPTAYAEEGAGAPTEIDVGRALYRNNCAGCHGPRMINPGLLSFDLRKFPPGDRERFFNAVKNGKGAMPSWKTLLSDAEIAALFAYVLTRGT